MFATHIENDKQNILAVLFCRSHCKCAQKRRFLESKDAPNMASNAMTRNTLALLHCLPGPPVVALSFFPMSLYVSEFQPSAAALSTSITSLPMT